MTALALIYENGAKIAASRNLGPSLEQAAHLWMLAAEAWRSDALTARPSTKSELYLRAEEATRHAAAVLDRLADTYAQQAHDYTPRGGEH